MEKLFFILFTAISIYANELISLNPDMEKIDNFKIYYHEDKTDNLEFNYIKNHLFNKTFSNRFSLGYLNYPVWLKVSVLNNSSKTNNYVLALEEPFFHSTALYYEKKGKLYSFENSIKQNIRDRQVPHPNNHFKISLEPYEEIELFIKVRSYFSTFSELFFYSEEYYDFHTKRDYFLYLIYLGAIGTIAFYNLILYLYLKEKIYLYYFGYTFSFGFWMALFSGLAYFFIPSKYGYYLHFFTPLAMIFLILFSNKLLNIKTNYPKIHKFTFYNLYFSVVLAVWIPLDLFIGFQLVNIVAAYTFILYFIVSLMEVLKGSIIAKYYLIAIGIFLVSISLLSLMTLGILPNTLLTRYLFIAGSFIEIVMFSLLLAFRINLLQKEYQAKLEKEINIKTQSIQLQNIQLQDLIHDKEILIKEIFHRVKNNFQILIAYLSMESLNEKNPRVKENTHQIISKINSLSIVNDMLYSQNDKEFINIKEYFERLFSNAVDRSISVELDIDSFSLKAALVKNLGLLVNEMITNTLKYKGKQNKVKIYFSLFKLKNDILRLEYYDSQEKFNNKSYKKGYGTLFIEEFASSLKNSQIEKGLNDFHYIITFEL